MSVSLLQAAAAPTPFAAPEAARGVATSSAAGAGEVMLALVLVLAVIFACAWCVKRMRNFGRREGRVLAIVDDLGVGQKERVVLLACGSVRLLVGVASGSVRLLHVVPPGSFSNVAEGAGGELAAQAPAPAARADFRAILRRSLGLPK